MIRRRWPLWLVCFASLSLSLSAQPMAKYELYFRRWASYYTPWADWHRYQAQGVVESGLNPGAVSSCGAIGVMQLMPATAAALKVNAWDAEQNIQGGVHYDAMLWAAWTRVPDAGERWKFTVASYNAGPGNIQRAQALANAWTWDLVAAALPRVTGKFAPETVTYVKRIGAVYAGGGR